MCGFVYLKNINDECFINLAKTRISNRGGDAEFEIFHKNSYFYHSRLAITGGEITGKQPVETDKNIYLFNGEIYNRTYLSNLLNIQFDPDISDTYLIVRCLEHYGTDVLECFDGPFSILIYDKKTENIECFRDHLGEKPLFKYQFEDSLIVSSDLGIISMFEARPRLSMENCEALVAKGYLDNTATIFQDVYKVSPLSHSENHFYKDYLGQRTTLQNTLNRIAGMQSVGASALLLSGGIDSLITGKILQESAPECYTFVPEKNSDHDESILAKKNARILNLNLNVIYSEKIYEKSNFDNTIFKLNEPVGDPSIFNQNLIFSEISKKYKICFCGTGADEIFHGYLRYRKNFVSKNIRFLKSFVKIHDKQSRLAKLLNEKTYSMEDDRQNYLPNQLFSASDSISFNSGIELRTPFTSILLRQHWKRTDELNVLDFVILKRSLKWLLLSKYKLNRFFLKKRGFTNDYHNSVEFVSIKNILGFKSESPLERLRIAILIRWLEQSDYFQNYQY